MRPETTTQSEAARRLEVHPNTVATMLNDGRLVPVDVSNGAGFRSGYRHVDSSSLARLESTLDAVDEEYVCKRCLRKLPEPDTSSPTGEES